MIRLKEPVKTAAINRQRANVGIAPKAKPPARKPVARRVAKPRSRRPVALHPASEPALQTCPSCRGTGKRPYPMTPAERQRKRRARMAEGR